MHPFVSLFLILLAISFVIAVLTLISPVALFALKAGLLPVPKDVRAGHWDTGDVWRWATLVAGGMTLLGFFGALWVGLMVLDGWPEAQRVYLAHYGAEACRYRYRSDGCLFGSIGNVIRLDAAPFFVATALLLYARAAAVYTRRHDKSIWQYMKPALVGGAVFFVSVHIWEWVATISHAGIVALIARIMNSAWHEVTAPYAFLMAAFGHAPGGVEFWIKKEFILLGGSFYKLASLYPKVLFVLLMAGFAHGLVAQQASPG
jgi:hypothetical protein